MNRTCVGCDHFSGGFNSQNTLTASGVSSRERMTHAEQAPREDAGTGGGNRGSSQYLVAMTAIPYAQSTSLESSR
ncbi:hypothetical protein IG631_05987 [Alternaria alternata]|nr:hypothetical protein IG631_05987 [Alternaria alternata]